MEDRLEAGRRAPRPLVVVRLPAFGERIATRARADVPAVVRGSELQLRGAAPEVGRQRYRQRLGGAEHAGLTLHLLEVLERLIVVAVREQGASERLSDAEALHVGDAAAQLEQATLQLLDPLAVCGPDGLTRGELGEQLDHAGMAVRGR